MNSEKQRGSIERIEGKGLRLKLSVFKKLKAFQSGGQYWEHQSQNSIREYMGDFLPLMQVEEDGESVLCQMFASSKEVSSLSRQAKGIPAAQRKKLEESIKRLKERASAPDVDSNVKKIIEVFKLPDPRKDPELYRLYGSRWNPKLMVVWGCEKEEGTSLPPEEVSRRVVKESVGGTFIRKLPIFLFIFILLGALAWFFSNSDFSKQDKVADGKPEAGIADSLDTDNDGMPDAEDAFPSDATETADVDGDGVGDKSDAFPNDATETADTDGDGTGDNADTDDDNDGTADAEDAFPSDATETADVDGDGVGDNSDAFPNDSAETADTDGDGTGDNADTDDDNDGTADTNDAFPSDSTETADVDGDGVGDNSDAFPSDSTETADTDGDGTGNNADTDDDNDGTPDEGDAFPLDKKETAAGSGQVVAKESDTLTVEDGPSTEEEIQERREDIKQALEEGEAIKPNKPARIANGDETNLAKLIMPAVVTIVVSENDGEYAGQGTGFLITEDGILVTNHHVVEKIEAAKAVLSDGRVISIKAIIASDSARDLALLRLPEGQYPFLRLADREEAKVGDSIAVMGSPQGLRNTYSTGIISAKRPGGPGGVDRLQISAPVSPGSSGSPVVDAEAKVVGIVQGGVTSKNAQALNIAIDVGELHSMLEEVSKSKKKVKTSIATSGERKAWNEKSPGKIPDDVLVPRKPKGKEVIWGPSPVPKIPSPAPMPPDPRLQLDEIDRVILADGRIKVRLKVKIKGENGGLDQVQQIECSLNNKRLAMEGDIVTFTTPAGDHSLRITWVGQSGKNHTANTTVSIGAIRVR
ncbi:trypsin-like peptidase domain-containing protein [Akkermansiaceae bacterium]|nr:trypsin-like peptidase domain-containing protein [Akkermansiaceae bacterium]